jgi:hypothetical protein
MNKPFAEIFSARHGLLPARYVPALLRRTLYLHAAVVAPVINLLWPGYFALDRELIRGVGGITRLDQLPGLLSDFRHDSRNHGLMRSRLRLRVSTRRLHRIVHDLLADPAGQAPPAGGSASPIDEAGAGPEAPGR